MKFFSDIIGFEWDNANISKNFISHKVQWYECEEVFFNKPYMVVNDDKHSQNEKRYYILGKTNIDRNLFLVFTLRKNRIRIISARDMHKKERKAYEELKKKDNS